MSRRLHASLLACLPLLGFAAVPTPELEAVTTSRHQLNAAIEKGPNRKMGFLSDANYRSVHTVLSKKVEPVIFTHTNDLYEAVDSGTVLAGLISGVPDSSRFNVFSTDIISPRSFQMMPGSEAQDLMEAVDAAVVRSHHAGEVLKAQLSSPPFEAVEVHNCRSQEPEKVPFPDAPKATGLLKKVLETRKLRVLGFGTDDNKPDWHQDGNYTANPPTGFWPAYMNYFMKHFQDAYGSDIQLERVWMLSGGTEKVLSGEIHMTEAYYIYENLYNGELKKWNHRFSCVVMGYEQQFFSKQAAVKVITDGSSGDKSCPEQLNTCVADRLKYQIRSRDMLNTALETGNSQKMGFLTEANYASVAPVLSDKVVPVIFTSTQALFDAVAGGDVLAGLISGVPDRTNFTVFSTDMISPRSFQMMPGQQSHHLMQAVDAAVVRTHNQADLLKAQQANPPFQVVEVHTCRADDVSKVPFPNASEATGLLKDVLDTRRLKILASGLPDSLPNWAQDGNYKVNPPTGFWPDYMNLWMAHFKEAYGSDIVLERVWMTAGGTDMVLSGAVHMTEPYYIYENLWQDRLKKWSHDFSCVVMGYEQNFFAPKAVLDFSAAGDTCEGQLAACRNENVQVSEAAQNQALHILGLGLAAVLFWTC